MSHRHLFAAAAASVALAAGAQSLKCERVDRPDGGFVLTCAPVAAVPTPVTPTPTQPTNPPDPPPPSPTASSSPSATDTCPPGLPKMVCDMLGAGVPRSGPSAGTARQPGDDGTDLPWAQSGKYLVVGFAPGVVQSFSTRVPPGGGRARGEIIEASSNSVTAAQVRLWLSREPQGAPLTQFEGFFQSTVQYTRDVDVPEGPLWVNVVVKDKGGNLHVMIPH
jgi:hypothetical protein